MPRRRPATALTNTLHLHAEMQGKRRFVRHDGGWLATWCPNDCLTFAQPGTGVSEVGQIVNTGGAGGSGAGDSEPNLGAKKRAALSSFLSISAAPFLRGDLDI
jgi:hypothetical protein